MDFEVVKLMNGNRLCHGILFHTRQVHEDEDTGMDL